MVYSHPSIANGVVSSKKTYMQIKITKQTLTKFLSVNVKPVLNSSAKSSCQAPAY